MPKVKRNYTDAHYRAAMKYQKEMTFQTNIRYALSNPTYQAMLQYSKDKNMTIRAILIKAGEEFMKTEGYLRVGEE